LSGSAIGGKEENPNMEQRKQRQKPRTKELFSKQERKPKKSKRKYSDLRVIAILKMRKGEENPTGNMNSGTRYAHSDTFHSNISMAVTSYYTIPWSSIISFLQWVEVNIIHEPTTKILNLSQCQQECESSPSKDPG
jgi:hypothetical protein